MNVEYVNSCSLAFSELYELFVETAELNDAVVKAVASS